MVATRVADMIEQYPKALDEEERKLRSNTVRNFAPKVTRAIVVKEYVPTNTKQLPLQLYDFVVLTGSSVDGFYNAR